MTITLSHNRYLAPASRCGDLNHDGAVNQLDLALIDAHIDGMDCPGLDINQNGIVDLDDRSVVFYHMNIGQNGSWCIGDINFDGVISQDDVDQIQDYLVAHNWWVLPDDPDWNPIYNLNCDGNIGRFDLFTIWPLDGNTCPSSN